MSKDGPGDDYNPLQGKSFFYRIKVIFFTFLLFWWCLVSVIINFIWRTLRLPYLEKSYFIFHGGCCLLFNLHCEVKGKLSSQRPTLFLSNHISYLDVFILGKYLPACFIAKSEVAGWPILGQLAKVQNTLFFERKSKRVKDQLQVMTQHFNEKGNLILFPEGTSTNGKHVVPFKSSLLQSVEQAELDVNIQPVTLSYTHYQNQKMTDELRDQYAWYATMPFAGHFFNALAMGKAKVELVFHEPVRLKDFATRKECAQYCCEQVTQALEKSLK